jgi:hypothetical protein
MPLVKVRQSSKAASETPNCRARVARRHHDELSGIGKRHAAQKDAVDNRKNSVVRADSECEHDDRNRGEPAVFQEQANGAAQVMEEAHTHSCDMD